MATLILCKACGRSIASDAERCPHCGHKRTGYGCAWLFLLGFLLLLLIQCGLGLAGAPR